MLSGMIFRKEPFFYGHDNYDQLVKICKVCRGLRLHRSWLPAIICGSLLPKRRFWALTASMLI